MRDGTWQVLHVERASIAKFIEQWHYSGSINGVMASHCFALYHNDEMVGAMLFGKLGMANAWKKYADKEVDVIELRRPQLWPPRNYLSSHQL